MERRATITSKGQVTIPHEIRRMLGVRAGDGLLFEGNGSEVRVRPLRRESPFAAYRGIGNAGIGTGRLAVIDWVRRLRGR